MTIDFLKLLPVAVALIAPSHATADTLSAQIAAAETRAAQFAGQDPNHLRGWTAFGGDEPLMGRHWTPPDAPDYISGRQIDPARPSNFMFTQIAGRQRLVALSYNVRIAPGEAVPDGFIGTSDVWHVHDIQDFVAAAGETRPLIGWLGRRWIENEIIRKDGRTRLAMVHLWLIPNPEGRFASHNPVLPYLDLGLPASWAEGLDAARGVALATPDGCDEALDGRLWVAGADRRTSRTLKSICARLADYVTIGLSEGRAALNRRGRAAHLRLEHEMATRLSAAEKARIASIAEHGDPAHGGHH